MNPRTIKYKYQKLRDLLDKETITTSAGLLGLDYKSVESTVHHLCSLGIDYSKNILLLGTKPKTKRQKIAYLLREVFNYRKLSEEQKKQALEDVLRLVRERPYLLVYSIKRLEKKIDYLKKQYAS